MHSVPSATGKAEEHLLRRRHHILPGKGGGARASGQIPGMGRWRWTHSPSQGDGHDDLFQGGVAGALPNPVDRALQLAGTCLSSCQGVGGGHPQIVLAMRGEDDVLCALRVLSEPRNEVAELMREGPPGGVWNVDGGCSSLDHLQQHRNGALSNVGKIAPLRQFSQTQIAL